MAALSSLSTFATDLFEEYRSLIVTVGFIVAGAALLVGGFTYHRFNVEQREQRAHAAFAECMQEYDRAFQGQDDAWLNVETLCHVAYEQHTNSVLAPFFLAYQAEALIQQKKNDEALAVMDQALAAMPSSLSVTAFYAIKRALMRLDSEDQAVKDAGLQELQALADDASNNAQDVALYYLGAYQWEQDNIDGARDTWEKLQVFAQGSRDEQSPWAVMAQDRLAVLA